MSRLLVLGMGPLLDTGVRRFGGQCLRTWYFTKPLIDDGHTVRLVTLPIYDPDDPAMEKAALVRRRTEGFDYQVFTNSDFRFIETQLRELVLSYKPDAIIAVNTLPASIAARLHTRIPLWADLNGYEMAEKQGQAARTGDDSPLTEAWRKESIIAHRADKISTVTRPQLHALLGEMAGLGRLNQHTFQYHFVHHIPNAAHPAFFLAAQSPPSGDGILRGHIVPKDAFVLLWSGGYNYWTDPHFLFDFLERAMQASPSLHYVSTGGAIAGYNNQTYATFCDLVDGSPMRERYHLLGWLPAEDLPIIYTESNLGLNIDEPNYETFFGARNRVNNMMAAGLPVLSTYGSEISRMLEDAECGIICFPDNTDELVQATQAACEKPDLLEKLAQRARSYALEEFQPEALTEPLREWAKDPAPAPDNAEKLRLDPNGYSYRKFALNPLDAASVIATDHNLESLLQAQIDLTAIRSKQWYRTGKAIKGLITKTTQIASRTCRLFSKSPEGETTSEKKKEVPSASATIIKHPEIPRTTKRTSEEDEQDSTQSPTKSKRPKRKKKK